MLELHVDEDALENARESLCFKCGSTRIVSSVSILPSMDTSGCVCKQCYDDMLSLAYERKVMFGCEGFLSDNLTIYDKEEIVQKVKKFNKLFEDKGCLAQLFPDNDYYFRMEIIVDDDQPELADAVKEAENLEKLCKDKVPFSRKRH